MVSVLNELARSVEMNFCIRIHRGKGFIFVFLRHFATKQSSQRKHRNSQLWDKAEIFPPQQQQNKTKKFPFGYCLQSLAQIPTTRNHSIN